MRRTKPPTNLAPRSLTQPGVQVSGPSPTSTFRREPFTPSPHRYNAKQRLHQELRRPPCSTLVHHPGAPPWYNSFIPAITTDTASVRAPLVPRPSVPRPRWRCRLCRPQRVGQCHVPRQLRVQHEATAKVHAGASTLRDGWATLQHGWDGTGAVGRYR